MSKKILECPYCGSIITEKDQICPKCGADCNSVIKKYHKEKEEELNKTKESLQKTMDEANKAVTTAAKVIIGVLIFVVIAIMVLIITFSINHKKVQIIGNLNKEITINDNILKISNFEEYEYYDDFFKDCNTKKGYKKVAFKITLENNSNETIVTDEVIKSISLKAEDELLSTASLKANQNFCKVLVGKAEYNKFPVTEVLPKDSITGYIGFVVPTDKEKLTFIINGNEKVKVHNPVYEVKPAKK